MDNGDIAVVLIVVGGILVLFGVSSLSFNSLWTAAVLGIGLETVITLGAICFVVGLILLIPGALWLHELNKSSGRTGGCCIIATCALPSQHPDLKYLRHFRDKVLKPTRLGRLIVWLYYSLGPFVAAIVLSSKRMKRLVRKRFIPFWVKVCKEWKKQEKMKYGPKRD